jgi:hypothetical protein
MTNPIPLTVTVSPATIPVSSPAQYIPEPLTLTINNQTAASYDLSNGLTISLPLDPGGGGTASEDALVLTDASLDPSGAVTPVVSITATSLTPDTWQIQEDTASGPCTFLAQPSGSGTLDANANIGFTFSQVVADLVTGTPNITVTVLPADASQPPLVLYAPVSKVASALWATIRAGNDGLSMPDNTTPLIWQTTDADRCRLDWDSAAAMVAYDNEQYYGSWTTNVPTQFPEDGPFPVATIYQQQAASFQLTAFGQGSSYPVSTPTIGLATPRLNALTIPPLVTGVAPPSGAPAGGQQVTITGTGLYGTNTTVAVSFGSASATAVAVNSDGSITATAPPGTGTVPVTVVTPAGSSPATPPASYTYAATGMPAVTGIDSPGGEAGGGQQVTITGTGLGGATAVEFGGVSAAGAITVNADGSITVAVPPYTLGAGTQTSTVPVTVTTSAGTSPSSPAALYTYAAAGVPVVFGVAQDGAGDPYGGQGPVTVTGVNFGAATSLSFGHAQTSNFTVDSTGTTITATAPPVNAADVIANALSTTVHITVTVSGGTTEPVTSAATSADQYTYAATAAAVTPNQPFLLIWSCYTGTGPTLQWNATETNLMPIQNLVKVTVGNETVTTGGPMPIPVSGSALVTSNAPVTFQLQVGTPGGPVPNPVPVSMKPLALIQPTAGTVTAANGTQSVVLSWTAHNATGFVLTGGGISNLSLPYDQRSYLVQQLPVTGPSTFELVAYGFGTAAPGTTVEPVYKYLPVQVTPVPVEITSLWISAPHIPWSTTSITVNPNTTVTLGWSARAATGFTLSSNVGTQSLGVGTTSATDTPAESTMYLLTALGCAPSGQPPTARVEAVVYHKPPKEQVAAGEKLPNGREKEPPDYPKVVLAHGTVPGPGDLAEPEPEPADGSLQAFVTPGERPDVVPPAEAGTEPPAAGPT